MRVSAYWLAVSVGTTRLNTPEGKVERRVQGKGKGAYAYHDEEISECQQLGPSRPTLRHHTACSPAHLSPI